MVAAARPVRWLPHLLYGAVLVAGLWDLTREPVAALRAIGFVTAIGVLAGLEIMEGRVGGPPLVFIAVRAVLFGAVAALDGSGLSNLLFLLVPFQAYFVFGRRVAVGLAAGAVVLLVGWRTTASPHWYRNDEGVTDVLMLAVGMVLAVAMASAAVGESEHRGRLRVVLQEVAELSAAAERTRVARDLHDSLGHHLTAVSIQLEKASAFRDRDAHAADQAVLDARRSARRALEEVRQAVRALSAPFSLSRALADLAGDGAGACAVEVDVRGDEEPHPLAARVALFRAAQEGLTNARRHAGAGRVTIAAAFDDDAARLVVADDGQGLPVGTAEGFGLRGMRARVALVGGTGPAAGPRPGGGVTVTVCVPRRAA